LFLLSDIFLKPYTSWISKNLLLCLNTKTLLKAALADRIPSQLVNRPKAGFQVPVEQWLRHDLKDLMSETLLSQKARERGLFDQNIVAQLIDQHVKGTKANHNKLWVLLMLELWFTMWIDPEVAPTA